MTIISFYYLYVVRKKNTKSIRNNQKQIEIHLSRNIKNTSTKKEKNPKNYQINKYNTNTVEQNKKNKRKMKKKHTKQIKWKVQKKRTIEEHLDNLFKITF